MKLIYFEGPVFYPSHHEVIKPHSESTRCHIKFNSFADFREHLLNNDFVKVLDILDNLLGILIRFQKSL